MAALGSSSWPFFSSWLLLCATVPAAFTVSHFDLPTRIRRVVGGQAQPREATAALTAIESSFAEVPGGVFLCGGTLIAPRIVITAAHCLYNEDLASYASAVKVVVNAYNRSRDGKEILTNKITLHPSYIASKFSPASDVALLELPEAVDICTHFHSPQVARLPLRSMLVSELSNASCYILGWGKTAYANESPIPLHADVTNVREAFEVGAAMFVLEADATGEPRACFGDSGGPLICEVDQLSYLVGVTSEIGGFSELGSSLPPDSALRCAGARRLTAFDLRQYMPAIYELLYKANLYSDVIRAQELCFGRQQ